MFFVSAIGQQEPCYKIPMSLSFPRNHNFTGRKVEQLEMQKVLHGSDIESLRQKIMVLCGLGGIGKSQLAAQYAYEHEDMYTSVWWVNANSRLSLAQDYFTILQQLVSHHAQIRTRVGQIPDYSWIATMLRLPTSGIDHAGQLVASTDMKLIIQAVKSWFGNSKNQNWLIIVDNYDDLEAVSISDFLPQSTGSVIITSRAQHSRRFGASLELDVIDREDGIEILRKSAGTKIDEFRKGLYATAIYRPGTIMTNFLRLHRTSCGNRYCRQTWGPPVGS